jgi:hypothetical protein
VNHPLGGASATSRAPACPNTSPARSTRRRRPAATCSASGRSDVSPSHVTGIALSCGAGHGWRGRRSAPSSRWQLAVLKLITLHRHDPLPANRSRRSARSG